MLSKVWKLIDDASGRHFRTTVEILDKLGFNGRVARIEPIHQTVNMKWMKILGLQDDGLIANILGNIVSFDKSRFDLFSINSRA